MPAQPVNRHDARMLQPPGDPGLPQEPRLAQRVMSVVALKLFERNLPIQLGIESKKDLAQTASRMRPDDAESLGGANRPRRLLSSSPS